MVVAVPVRSIRGVSVSQYTFVCGVQPVKISAAQRIRLKSHTVALLAVFFNLRGLSFFHFAGFLLPMTRFIFCVLCRVFLSPLAHICVIRVFGLCCHSRVAHYKPLSICFMCLDCLLCRVCPICLYYTLFFRFCQGLLLAAVRPILGNKYNL